MKKKIVILGAGESGVGAALLAQKHGHAVFVSDMGTISSSHQTTLKKKGILFEQGKHSEAVVLEADEIIKSPYILEFLNIPERTSYSEKDLETSIINHLQEFLIEMGRGFCFEARQKRISFNNKHYRIDLVFYHRILKCHILLDLKIGDFDHADAGQMNVYLNYYKENEMTANDNPPIGIILCSQKDNALVHYATGGLSKEIFVSKYKLQLPSEEELAALIESDLKLFGNN